MRALPALVAALAACGSPYNTWRPKPAQLAPMPRLDPQVTSTIGPLALDPGAGETPHPAVQEARRVADDHYLDAARIEQETATYLAFVETFYQPLTEETRIGYQHVRESMTTLKNLAPYSVSNVTLAYSQSSERLHVCILPAGMLYGCRRERSSQKLEATPPGPAFEIGEAAPGIGLLTVRRLDASDDVWRTFAAATRTLDKQRGLVLDLRNARGNDPRPLAAWVAALAGQPDVKPLRAIERPPSADSYVEAYNARFTDRGRDVAVWRELVAASPAEPRKPSATTSKKPITIIIGPGCESACELATRVLQTYAGAFVMGGASTAGRIARDEPAMFVLPHSQTSVYFHATRYLMSTEIEAATGPTEEWNALGGDASVVDPLEFAVRDITQRLEHGGWPRCESLFPTASPPLDSPKLQGVAILAGNACSSGARVLLHSDVPASALKRFVATCAAGVEIQGWAPGMFGLTTPKRPSPSLLARIAASELVKQVQVECQPEYHLLDGH